MMIPEDDSAKGQEEGFACSPQTMDTFIEQTQKLKEYQLSVILSEGDSHYFEESEGESNYGGEVDSTLKTGKETSKKKKSKRQIKQEKRVKKKEQQAGKGGMCGTGQDKACCLTF
jgi:hypothetical protein